MALILPPNFKNDIQGRDTALIPLVVIGEFFQDVESIRISTNETSLLESNSDFKPLLLNIPSLKESIDIETRKYKISSINIDISNLPYEGKRFSELIAESTYVDSSLINTNCNIFWASPSAKTFNPFLPDEIALHIYSGTIRRYTHDDEKVRLVVEDRSQATLHKDLPLTNLGTGDDVPDKYKNKPIPMVYGHVDRSPCVFIGTYDTEYDFFQVSRFLIDSSNVKEKIETTITIANKTIIETPLYLADSGYTFNCTSEGNALNDGTNFISYDNTAPYIDLNLDTSIENSSNLGFAKIRKLREPIKAFPRYYGQGGDGNQSNRFAPPGGNNSNNFPPIPPQGDYIYDDNSNTYWILLQYGQNDEAVDDNGRNSFIYFNGSNYSNAEAAFATLSFAPLSADFDVESKIFANFTIKNVTDGSLTLALAAWLGEIVPHYNTTLQTQAILLNQSAQTALIALMNAGNLIEYDTYSGTNIFEGGIDITNLLYTFNVPTGTLNLGIPFHTDHDLASNSGVAIKDFIIKDLVLFQEGVSGDLNNYDFYANVIGRLEEPTAPEVIAHIMDTELDVSGIDDGGSNEYNNMEYALTVDKKINSKKLFEGIASASPYIPRFDNMGDFKFDVIPLTGGSVTDDLGGNETIKEADVIDFSFSRTKIEDVYNKVEFKYKWDYARDEFGKEVEIPVNYQILNAGSFLSGYDPDYYGQEVFTTLIIDDDRGKYIRNDDTAKRFAWWILSWHLNQHLKIKVRLPLKYMNVEIGDTIEFDKDIGGVKPYGNSYHRGIGLTLINGQQAYPKFIVTSTNKTLEYCEIECLQLHKLFTELACLDGSMPDCNGICGGGAVEDDCGVCGGSDDCCPDGEIVGCDNNCSENPLVNDECGVCGGDDSTCSDCDGVPGGDAYYDNCDDCVGGDTGVEECELDCNGEWGGNALVDDCGVCGGGVFFEGAGSPEDCEECPEGLSLDCAGECGGDLTNDECGVCGGDNSTCEDCSGLPNSGAYYDACGWCVGGDTGEEPCIIDCDGVEDGTAIEDECGVCEGDNSSCADCAGTPYGDAVVDCMDVCEGVGEIDQCGNCVAGGGDGTNHIYYGSSLNQTGLPGTQICPGYQENVIGGSAQLACNAVCDEACIGDEVCAWCPNAGYYCDCNGNTSYDECGVCGGDGSACSIENGCGQECLDNLDGTLTCYFPEFTGPYADPFEPYSYQEGTIDDPVPWCFADGAPSFTSWMYGWEQNWINCCDCFGVPNGSGINTGENMCGCITPGTNGEIPEECIDPGPLTCEELGHCYDMTTPNNTIDCFAADCVTGPFGANGEYEERCCECDDGPGAQIDLCGVCFPDGMAPPNECGRGVFDLVPDNPIYLRHSEVTRDNPSTPMDEWELEAAEWNWTEGIDIDQLDPVECVENVPGYDPDIPCFGVHTSEGTENDPGTIPMSEYQITPLLNRLNNFYQFTPDTNDGIHVKFKINRALEELIPEWVQVKVTLWWDVAYLWSNDNFPLKSWCEFDDFDEITDSPPNEHWIKFFENESEKIYPDGNDSGQEPIGNGWTIDFLVPVEGIGGGGTGGGGGGFEDALATMLDLQSSWEQSGYSSYEGICLPFNTIEDVNYGAIFQAHRNYWGNGFRMQVELNVSPDVDIGVNKVYTNLLSSYRGVPEMSFARCPDINFDGGMSILDLMLLQTCLLQGEGGMDYECQTLSDWGMLDINWDSTFSIFDFILMMNMVLDEDFYPDQGIHCCPWHEDYVEGECGG